LENHNGNNQTPYFKAVGSGEKNGDNTRIIYQEIFLKANYSDIIIYICTFHKKEIRIRKQ